MSMNLHQAAEVLRKPKDYWSHEKDEAIEFAKQLLLEVDTAAYSIDKYYGTYMPDESE